jgi:hypothetical protein
VADLNATLTLNVSGSEELLRKAVSIVRNEVASALREAAAGEVDGRVAMRLSEVAGKMDGTLASAEAQIASKIAPNPNERRRTSVIEANQWATTTSSEKA